MLATVSGVLEDADAFAALPWLGSLLLGTMTELFFLTSWGMTLLENRSSYGSYPSNNPARNRGTRRCDRQDLPVHALWLQRHSATMSPARQSFRHTCSYESSMNGFILSVAA